MKRTTLVKTTVAGSIAAVALAAAGCSLDVYTAQPEPRAVVYEEAPPPQQEVVVAEAPPAVVYEEPPPQPEVGVVWVQPEYVQIGGRYELRHGHWDHPPRGHNRWVASHYEHGSRGYVYVGGRWD
jgi:hypothetical protein